MSDNIVIFGPTHSGKSTLLGYLKVYDMQEDEYERCNLRTQKMMEESGLKYKKDMALAYYVDKGIDERTRYNKKEKSLGNSKRIHIEKMALDIELNCVFIDTPGSDVAWKHKYEGLFMGDIGIYIIEISKLSELSRKVVGSSAYNTMVNRLFSPVYLWKHYKRMKRLIVVISKIDLAQYSAYTIRRAESTLRSINILKEVPIVPICIDVENRISHNVIGCACNEMNWYKGKSLIDELKLMIHKEHKEKTDNTLAFAHIERLIPKTKFNNQPALRVKILNGSIHKGDEIYVGPIKYYNDAVIIKGIVSSLKHETSGCVNCLSKGEIGGIIFSKIYYGRDRLKLTDEHLKLKRTSMIFQNIQECQKGNLLYFNIFRQNLSKEEDNYLMNMNIGNRIKIIWFGKIIGMHLINKIFDRSKYSIVLLNTSAENSMFMLPLKEDGKLLYDKFIFQLSDLLFANANLSDLEIISEESRREILFIFEGKVENIYVLKGLKIDMECTYNPKLNETNIFWKNITNKNIMKIMQSTEKFLKNKGIKQYKINILPQKKNV